MSKTAPRVSQLLISALIFTGTACTWSEEPNEQSCPTQARFAVLWSSESSHSRIQYYDHNKEVSEEDINVQGLPTLHSVRHNNSHIFTISNGNPVKSQSHLVSVDRTACVVDVAPLPSHGIQQFTVDNSAIFGIDTINFEAGLFRHDLKSGQQTARKYPQEGAYAVAVTGNRVAFITRDDFGSHDSPTSRMRVFDKENLDYLWEASVPIAAAGEPVTLGEKVVLGEVLGGDDRTPSSRVLTIDLDSRRVEETTLRNTLPMLLRADNDRLYIGHTFMNPIFKNMWDYRDFTVLDLADQREIHYSLDEGIIQIEIDDEKLYSFGFTAEDQYQVSTYELSSMRRLASTNIARPEDLENTYPSGFFLLE